MGILDQLQISNGKSSIAEFLGVILKVLHTWAMKVFSLSTLINTWILSFHKVEHHGF